MIIRPTVFLDIDGVLNTPSTPGFQTPQGKIELALVANLNTIARAFPAGIDIVISSYWRVWHDTRTIAAMLLEAGLSHRAIVIGKTPETGQSRGREIRDWLLNNPYVNSHGCWCIIDDNPWMLRDQQDKFVMTNSSHGLTADKAADVIHILKSAYK